MSDSLYAVLGVAADAELDELRLAYRRLARRHHPDLNPDDPLAPDRFRRITDAYQVLVDPDRRAEHDRSVLGRATDAGPETGRASVFQQAGRRQATDGRHVVSVLEIDLTQAIDGGVFDVEATGPVRCADCDGEGWDVGGAVVTCWTCHGKGTMSYENRFGTSTGMCLTCAGEKTQRVEGCPTCNGDGTVIATRTVRVTLPPGVDDGDTLTIAGAGGPGGSMGRSGDLLVVIQVRPHPVFRRDGLDLIVDVPVTYGEAVFGADIAVPTMDGPVTIRMPPGTQGGSTYRVTGRGVAGRDGTGDLLVVPHIVVPTDPPEEERASVEDLRRFEPSDLRTRLFDQKP